MCIFGLTICFNLSVNHIVEYLCRFRPQKMCYLKFGMKTKLAVSQDGRNILHKSTLRAICWRRLFQIVGCPMLRKHNFAKLKIRFEICGRPHIYDYRLQSTLPGILCTFIRYRQNILRSSVNLYIFINSLVLLKKKKKKCLGL